MSFQPPVPRLLSSFTCFAAIFIMCVTPLAQAFHEDMTSNFECIGTYGSGENYSSFVAQDHYVYLDHGSKLHVLDISDPSKPKEITSVPSPGILLDIKDKALIFDGGHAFNIMDVSDPFHPRRRGSVEVDVREYTARRMGDYLIADENVKNESGYSVYNIRNPFEPKEIAGGAHSSQNMIRPFCTDGTQFFQAIPTIEWGNIVEPIYIKDLTTSPTTIGTIPATPDDEWTVEYEVSSNGVVAKYADTKIPIPLAKKGNRIWHMDPVWHSTTLVDDWILDEGYEGYGSDQFLSLARSNDPKKNLLDTNRKSVGAAIIANKTLYALISENIKIYDLTGSVPIDRGAFPSISAPRGPIQVIGSLIIINSEKGLHFYDISKPTKPVPSGEFPFNTHEGVEQVKISGSRAYMIDGEDGLAIADFTDLKNPKALARHQLSKGTRIMTLQGDRLFLSDGDSGFHILDCSNPKSPKTFGAYREGLGPMCVNGSKLCMAKDGLRIIDLSNPTSITMIGYLRVEGFTKDIASNGTMVYLLTNKTVSAIEAKNPAKPVLIGAIDNPKPYEGEESQFLKRLGNALYVITPPNNGYKNSSYDVIDISNPAAMEFSEQSDKEKISNAEKASAEQPVNPKATHPGWYLCLPFWDYSSDDHWSGLVIYDCSEPLHPRYAGCYDHNSAHDQVLLYKDTIFFANDGSGLLMLRHISPGKGKNLSE